MLRPTMAIALIGILSSMASAEIPSEISFQGVLKDSSGAPVEDNVYAIKFAIFDDSVLGATLWESAGFVPIQTRDGLFNYVLGSTNPIPDSIAKYHCLWVGIRVNLEPELSPRTELTSMPFSFLAQYSDTATVSLDKTIDAGELTIGNLDTARFSAYQDLISEGKVGQDSTQVAIGNHTHTRYAATMGRYEDTTTVSGPNPIKSISIPPNVIGDYFKISFPSRFATSTDIIVTVTVNGQIVFNRNMSMWSEGSLSVEVNAHRCGDEQWIFHSTYIRINDLEPFGQLKQINLTASDGLLIQVSISGGTTIIIGNLIVEYDMD